MKKDTKIRGTTETWESRELGCSEDHVEVFDINAEEVDQSLDLQLISIRLQKGLIEDLKQIASFHGMGYQPLIRNQLTRFVSAEVKLILRRINEERAEKSKQIPFEDDSPPRRHSA